MKPCTAVHGPAASWIYAEMMHETIASELCAQVGYRKYLVATGMAGRAMRAASPVTLIHCVWQPSCLATPNLQNYYPVLHVTLGPQINDETEVHLWDIRRNAHLDTQNMGDRRVWFLPQQAALVSRNSYVFFWQGFSDTVWQAENVGKAAACCKRDSTVCLSMGWHCNMPKQVNSTATGTMGKLEVPNTKSLWDCNCAWLDCPFLPTLPVLHGFAKQFNN